MKHNVKLTFPFIIIKNVKKYLTNQTLFVICGSTVDSYYEEVEPDVNPIKLKTFKIYRINDFI